MTSTATSCWQSVWHSQVKPRSTKQTREAVQLVIESCVKVCLNRHDSGVYTDSQFLRAVSHSMAAHSSSVINDNTAASDSNCNVDDNVDTRDDIARVDDDNERAAVTADCCQVCLVWRQNHLGLHTDINTSQRHVSKTFTHRDVHVHCVLCRSNVHNSLLLHCFRCFVVFSFCILVKWFLLHMWLNRLVRKIRISTILGIILDTYVFRKC